MEYRLQDTEVVDRRCVYCDELATKDSDGSYHNNDYEEYYTCKCETLQKIEELNVKIRPLNREVFLLNNQIESLRKSARASTEKSRSIRKVRRLMSSEGVTLDMLS